MTPFRSGNRGTLLVDIKVRGIPIRRATGCRADRRGRADHAAIIAMLRSFGDRATERIDLLRDIAAGRRTIPEVFAAYRKGELDKVATGPRANADLGTAWTTWVERSGGGNVGNRTYALPALLGGRDAARVSDLPELVRAMLEHYRDTKQPRTGNQYRVIVLAFLRDVLGKRHALRGEVADVPPLPYKASHGHPCTVLEALAIRRSLSPKHADHWWSLCLSGMRSKEYFTPQWVDVGDWYEIAGTKTSASERLVPKVEAITPPTTRYKAFRTALAKVSDRTPHDARRSYRIWLREAGVALVDRDLILGHAGRDMAAIYEHREQRLVLAQVAAKLKAYLATQRKLGMRRVG